MKRFISVCLAILLVSLFYTSALADNTPPADQIAGNLYSDSGSWINPQKSGDFAISLTAYGIEKRVTVKQKHALPIVNFHRTMVSNER